MDNESLYEELWVNVKFTIQDSVYCKRIREQDYAPAFGTAICEKCVEKACKFFHLCVEHNAMQIRDMQD